MDAVVGRKLVKNVQERILQRIVDSVISHLFFDVSDFKEADNTSSSILPDVNSQETDFQPYRAENGYLPFGAERRMFTRPGQLKIIKQYFTSDKDCFSAPDIRGLFDAKDSAPVSDYADSGSSNHSFSTTDLAVQERTSFTHPGKRAMQ